MIVGTPGIVAPITPPEDSCSRARYHVAGAVNCRCGSFAISVDPVAERVSSAAHAFEAPASPRGATGQNIGSGPACANWVSPDTPGTSWAYSGRAATPAPGMSGRMSASRFSSGNRSDVRARSTSSRRWLESCSAISLTNAIESAGCQGANGALNTKNSGAPRPRLSRLISAIRAFTPAE